MEESGDDTPPSDKLERLKACAGSFRRVGTRSTMAIRAH